MQKHISPLDMNDTDFPALYQDADSAANRIQGHFYWAIIGVTVGSVISAVVPMFKFGEPKTAVFQSIGFFFALACSIYLALRRPQKTWYGARALAESLKTMSWRYVMRAEPYHDEDRNSERDFSQAVTNLLFTNKDASALNFASRHGEFFTKRMREIRSSDLQERVQIYKDSRVIDQRNWYRRKAQFNALRSRDWYIALIISSFLAMLSALFRIAYREAWIVPVDVVSIFPVAILGWIQSTRYQELSSSYALTGHEIAIIGNDLEYISDESELSKFVGDAENAFSREHTQWQARRDEA